MPPQLENIPLGKTNVRITPLGLGIWQWGDTLMWGYGKTYGDQDLRPVYDDLLAAGINFIDTAELYGRGRSERVVGQFMQQTNTRDQVVLATKFFPMPYRMRRGDLVKALKGSLNRLGLSRVDLYQIHWPPLVRSIEFWADALVDAVEAGLTRAVGVSNYNVEQTRRAYEVLAKRGVPLASNQVEYSLVERKPETSGLVKLCRELGVTIIAYSPIAKGALTGKYTPESAPPGVRRLKYNRRYLTRIQPLISLLKEIGQAHGGKTSSQVSLNWLISKGAVPIPGAKSLKQARENFGALGWQLSEEAVAKLDEASNQITGIRDCEAPP